MKEVLSARTLLNILMLLFIVSTLSGLYEIVLSEKIPG